LVCLPKTQSFGYLSPCNALLSPQLWCTLPEGIPPAHSGLHTHLHRLHWAEGNVCKELGTSRGSQVEAGAIEIGILLGGDGREGRGVGGREVLIEIGILLTLRVALIWMLPIRKDGKETALYTCRPP